MSLRSWCWSWKAERSWLPWRAAVSAAATGPLKVPTAEVSWKSVNAVAADASSVVPATRASNLVRIEKRMIWAFRRARAERFAAR